MKPSLQTQKQDALQKIADLVRFRHFSLNTERTFDEGAIITDLQTVLGHSDVRTTSGYVHPKADRVKSPMEGIA